MISPDDLLVVLQCARELADHPSRGGLKAMIESVLTDSNAEAEKIMADKRAKAMTEADAKVEAANAAARKAQEGEDTGLRPRAYPSMKDDANG